MMKKGKDVDFLAEKRTELAEKRTEMAHERTMMANLRTATTLILFGIAFLGFSEERFDFFFVSGVLAIFLGVVILVFAIASGARHSREISRLKGFFGGIVRHSEPSEPGKK